MDQAIARIPASIVQSLEEQLRGEFRELQVYEPREASADTGGTPFEGLIEAELDPNTD